MSTYLLPNFLQKVHHVRLTGGLIEGEGIIYCLYDGARGFSEVGGIIWGGLGSLFMVEKLGYRSFCFRKNGLGDRHGHRHKELNEAKYIWYAIYLLVFILNYFSSL